MPLETFYGPAICIDVSRVEPPDTHGRDLEQALREPARFSTRATRCSCAPARRPPRRHAPPTRINTRVLDDAAADWLRDRGVKVFGVDSPSPDNPISRTYPVHMMCRANGITHYENLANLDAVAGRRFTFIGFPLKIRAGTGSPVRAVAVLED